MLEDPPGYMATERRPAPVTHGTDIFCGRIPQHHPAFRPETHRLPVYGNAVQVIGTLNHSFTYDLFYVTCLIICFNSILSHCSHLHLVE